MAEEVIDLLFGVDGGGSIDGKSGQRIVTDLTAIVNKINKGKTTVPKVQLQYDTKQVEEGLKKVKKHLQDIAKMGHVNITGIPSGKSSEKNNSSTKQESEKYRALTATVKQYYAELAKVEKIQMKSTAVQSTGAGWTTTDAQYNARIQKINQLKREFDQLGFSAKRNGDIEIASAQQLNITEQQRAMLLNQVRSAVTANGIAHQQSSAQISAAWDKNAAKVHEYILRMREVAQKNPEVKQMMNELDSLATSGSASNLDELTTKFARLQQKIRESGADVETWGQKMSKTLGTRIRSLLAGIITTKIAQYIRQIYTNVVELDKALVNLQIASGKSRSETRALIKEYAVLARQLGATTVQVAEAADTWLRQGYSTEDTTTLIRNSTMLSKLGQMEAAEASKALTSAMKGYKVEVNDSINIIDKFTAVDMKAAASAGDIATAMAETATSADIAGVSMDKLIGYIATVKEVTQDGAESVGTFYKTLFARMNNVAAGKFTDDETGESLNDVESVLGELDIRLRGLDGQFRNSGDVLDEVASRWASFDTVAQHAIATAFAGTRQQEKFIVLMENYGSALDYAQTATNSAGTAMEKYTAYTEGVQGKIESLKATFEALSMTVLNSNLVGFFADTMRVILDVLLFADGFGAKLVIVIASVAALTYATNVLSKAFAKQKTVIAGGFGNFVSYIKYVQAMTLSNGTATAVVDAHTAAIVRQYTTGLTGILTFIPRTIAAFAAWIISNIKAKLAMDASTASAISLKTALSALNVNPWMLAITAVVAALAGLVAAFHSADKARQEAYTQAKQNAEEQQALVEQYDSEIDALESLQQKLIDARGNRQALAQLYSELNGKVAVSAGLLQGEEAAIKAVNAQLEDQIAAKKRLREEALKDKIAYERAAFESNTATQYGMFGWDWARGDASGAYMRNLMNGALSTYFHPFFGDINYDIFYDQWTTEQQNKWLEDHGFTPDSWKSYWDAQVSTAQDVFADVINSSTGIFGSDFMNSVVQRLILGGHTLDSAHVIISDLLGSSDDFNAQFSEYYNAVTNNLPNAQGLYDSLIATLDEYIEKYPELSKIFTDLIATIRTPTGGSPGITVELKSAADILNEIQEGFDGIAGAMTDVTGEGYLTADALATLFNLQKDNKLAGLDLSKVLIQDANGYKLADNALQLYVQSLITAYSVQGAFKTRQDRQNAIDTLVNLQSVLATLIATQNDSTDASKARRQELEKEKEAYEDQLDKFEELIELRKELLQSYKEELDYQKELDKRQQNVSTLQTKLAIARLDQSAAGQARVRQLEADLKEAQDELDDFTLEHAIDVLTDELDDTSAEWKAMIKGKLDTITNLLEQMDNTPDVNVSVDTSWAQSMLAQITQLIASLKQGTGATRWTSHSDAVKAGFNDVLTEREFNRLGSAKTLYGSYDDYLDAMYKKYMGIAPTYHTGGFVGGTSYATSNEEFAKLLQGEFVSTPAQMKRFMEDTLPKIANYTATGSRNEFHAPLIEITCENVTTESLPELEGIVKRAVETIKRELDSGMSRTGFKRPMTKRLV